MLCNGLGSRLLRSIDQDIRNLRGRRRGEREQVVTKESSRGEVGGVEQAPGTGTGEEFIQPAWCLPCLDMFRPCERVHGVVGNVGGCRGAGMQDSGPGQRGSRARLSRES